MTGYKIEIRGGIRQHSAAVATLGVSVTSANWQGEKFAAILNFAAANFDVIRIDVTDALYRHNFMASGADRQEALAQANALGALWLARHQDMIGACSVKPQVIRWAEWYVHSEYEAVRDQFLSAYEKNNILQQAINDDVMAFHRRKKMPPSLREIEYSKEYLIEELAVITLQARQLSGVRLYPGEELNCFKAIRKQLVPEAPVGLQAERYAQVRFVKRGSHVFAASDKKHNQDTEATNVASAA